MINSKQHQLLAIVDTVIGPGLLLAITENMDAVQAGLPAQNIINDSFKQVYGLIGGTGCTICLIIVFPYRLFVIGVILLTVIFFRDKKYSIVWSFADMKKVYKSKSTNGDIRAAVFHIILIV